MKFKRTLESSKVDIGKFLADFIKEEIVKDTEVKCDNLKPVWNEGWIKDDSEEETTKDN